MHKRVIEIALFAVTLLFLSACGEKKDSGNSIDESRVVSTEDVSQGIPMTREYVIEQGILTEEELVGVDFEAMAKKFKLTEGDENQTDIRGVVLCFRDSFPAPGYGFDYQYLVDTEKSKERVNTEDFAGLQTIALQYNSGNYNVSLVFDLEEKQAYWGENVELLKRGADPTEQKELSEQDVEDLKALLSDNHVEKWGKGYAGTSVGTTGSFSWELYYELEDGRIYRHAGNGVLGNNAPNNYEDVADSLKAYFSIPI